ncbi:glycine oxidase ThiO [Bacillus sp. ISL-51]|uniref:glycine oxidase ThiO n=1 Tax=Bacteria TaxID=2 RepID=UPI001BEC7726|nr:MULTISPECIES: glycine oxidase ThiO [Bacteria]MBT2573798.1 glycine oxidase ThiO [Bacillus sp. ISL-51]MBT2634870.1 glycine oxidase ThiO [Bacillus sp. ISL-26]MBT2712344.1 glycine oxidase ThiO [Pseudomonas sp. ISL-88]
MKKHYDTAVIGGGIIGTAIAYELAKNKQKTVLFESGTIGKRTTSAAAGMLGAHAECENRDAFFDFAMHSQRLYETAEKELQEAAGIDIRRHNGGMLKLAYSKEDVNRLRQMDDLPSVTWLSAKEALEKEPFASKDILGASLIKDDVHVEPYYVCKAYAKGARRYGAECYEHTHVIEIKRDKEAFCIKTSAGAVYADQVAVASGVWSGQFFAQLGLGQPFFPVKGECLSVWNDEIPLTRTLYHDHCYVVPRKSGRLVIGATMKPGDWSDTPDIGGLEEVIKKAKSMLPAIEHMKMDQFWAGLRPGTKDGKPFIGRHPEDNGLVFAAGHFRNGILLAPATAEMVRNLVLNQEVKTEWQEAFRIDRKEAVQV